MTYTVTNMTVELGEQCKVEVEQLHNALLSLPADIYLELYRRMTDDIYPPL